MKTASRLWQFVHNCLAHPLEGLAVLLLGRCPLWVGRFHNWSVPAEWATDCQDVNDPESIPPGARLDLTLIPEGGEERVLLDGAIDGDTFRFFWLVPGVCRVRGIDAPERDTEHGRLAKARAEMLLPAGMTATLRIHGRDKYGRTLAGVTEPLGRDFAALMIAEGHAMPWDGSGRKPGGDAGKAPPGPPEAPARPG
jgi:endonuclease YncB( thermonuclease family)